MSDVGDVISAENARWSFGGDVADAFDRHVRRSVPLYEQGHALVAALSDFFLADGSVCYELGCATGQLTRHIAQRHAGRPMRFVAVDNEARMCARAREVNRADPRVGVLHDDIIGMQMEPADLIVAYYTVQFVRPRVRQQLLEQIYRALNWGGAFIMFEKVRGPDARFQDILSALYVDHKLDQGYNGAEIVAKSRSLKGVLEPFSTDGNIGLLRRAGFVDITTVMKYICFEGFLAIK